MTSNLCLKKPEQMVYRTLQHLWTDDKNEKWYNGKVENVRRRPKM